MQMVLSKISERHVLIAMLLCYMSLLLDSQRTTGVIGYIRTTYSEYFLWFLSAYAISSVVVMLFWKKAPPLALLLAGFPILAYCIMGLWFIFRDPGAPLGAFFIHLSAVINVLWLVRMRIRGVNHGNSMDDTILPDSAN